MKEKADGENPIKTIFPWIPVALWMILIFMLSSQTADRSDQASTGIADLLIKMISRFAPSVNIDTEEINHIIRKLAHFFSYLIMSILLMSALNRINIKESIRITVVMTVCAAFASLDEIHQLFVSGRGSQLRDVFIDILGAIFGIILLLIFGKAGKVKKEAK